MPLVMCEPALSLSSECVKVNQRRVPMMQAETGPQKVLAPEIEVNGPPL